MGQGGKADSEPPGSKRKIEPGLQPKKKLRTQTAPPAESTKPIVRTQSGRISKPLVTDYNDIIMAMKAEVEEATKGDIPGEILCLETMCPDYENELANMNYDFLAMKAISDPDTMYMHEAMKEPDQNLRRR